MLASPVRRDDLTRAHLPTPFLLKFNPIRDPSGEIPGYTSVPIDLYSKVDRDWWRQSTKDSTEPPQPPQLGHASYLPLRAPIYDARPGMQRQKEDQPFTLDRDKPSYSLPAGTGPTLSKLLRRLVVQSLTWPMRNEKRSILSLDEQLGYDERGIPNDLNNTSDVVALLYFGGKMRTSRLLDMESKGLRVQHELARIIAKGGIKLKEVEQFGLRLQLNMQPRVSAPHLTLPTIKYQYKEPDQAFDTDNEPWMPTEYRIPVFGMIDILGEELAQHLLETGRHQGSKWICIKESRVCANALQTLLQAAWWFQESNFEIDTLTNPKN
jgi:hypothetical protein